MLIAILVLIVITIILHLPWVALYIWLIAEAIKDFKLKNLKRFTDAELVEEQERRLNTSKK